jgi:hypothetical protein
MRTFGLNREDLSKMTPGSAVRPSPEADLPIPASSSTHRGVERAYPRELQGAVR